MIKKIRHKTRNLFFAGLLVIVPTTVTVYLFIFLLNKFDKLLYPAVLRMFVSLGISVPLNYRIPGLGFALLLIVVLLVGFLATNILGKKVIGIGEVLVSKIPLAGNIYAGAKQVIEAVSADYTLFRQVVLIEYPRKGLYSIGFITCDSTFSGIQRNKDEHLVNVFIPTTPNPTSGVLVFLPEKDISPLALSIEEGIKLVISGGIVKPANKKEKI